MTAHFKSDKGAQYHRILQSRLSTDNKKEFFYSLMNDTAVKQSIILTMDLISAQETRKQNNVILNEIGQELLDEIKNYGNSKLISIHNNKFEIIKN